MKQHRIVSLLPSATEVVHLVGASNLMVGRSHECDYPKSLASLPVLTAQRTQFTTPAAVDTQVREALKSGESLYTVNSQLLEQLKPTVIVTQDLCNVCSIDLDAVCRIAGQLDPRPEIVSLNPHTLEEVLDSLTIVGRAVGMEAEAKVQFQALQDRVDGVKHKMDIKRAQPGFKSPTVAFIEWTEPLYVGGHWTPQLIEMAGGLHTLNRDYGSKSFAVSKDTLVKSDPDLVIVAPCGLDLDLTEQLVNDLFHDESTHSTDRLGKQVENDANWFRNLRAVKQGDVVLVDGNQMFNRPGPRLVDCLEWLFWVLHTSDRSRVPESLREFPFRMYSPSSAGDSNNKAAARPVVVSGLTPEIEEAHCAALAVKAKTYIDPHTGYTVFTEVAALERGYCCGRGCRHCPFGHVSVPNETLRKNKISEPVLMKFHKNKAKATDGDPSPASPHTALLFWSGGKDSYLALLSLLEQQYRPKDIVLFTTFQRSDNIVPEQDIPISEVVAQAKALGVDLMMIPLSDQCPNIEYVEQLGEAVRKFAEARSLDKAQMKLVFGDLHLKDIRDWRQDNLAGLGIECEFPLFQVPYAQLVDRLWTPGGDVIVPPISKKANAAEIVFSSVKNANVPVNVGDHFSRETYSMLSGLDGVDSFGECGEFHTAVKFRRSST